MIELLQLLKTRFINPSNKITLRLKSNIQDDDVVVDTCDLDNTIIDNLDDDAADKIHRFIRLWRKLGNLSIRDLDLAIHVLGKDITLPNQYDIDEQFLLNLAQMMRLNQNLNLPLRKLLSFWADIDTYIYNESRDDSPYVQLFQNKSVIYPLDIAFKLKEPGREI